MNTSGGPPALALDPKDPRTRYTIADVAMKLAYDGPWYVVIAVVLVLALRGTTTALESMNGIALALLARNRPPEQPDKAGLLRGVASGIATGVVVLLVFGAVHVAFASPAPRGDVRPVSVVK